MMNIFIRNNQGGFSLIELVLGIVVVSVALVGAMASLANIEAKSVQVEIVNRGTNYANNIMETIISHRFDEEVEAPWSTSLGPEENNIDGYDDIDDYHLKTWSSSTLPGYTGTSLITYASADDWLGNNSTTTAYKTVTVKVTHSELDVPIVLKTLVTSGVLTFGDISDDNDDDGGGGGHQDDNDDGDDDDGDNDDDDGHGGGHGGDDDGDNDDDGSGHGGGGRGGGRGR